MSRRLSHWLVMLLACVVVVGVNVFTGEFGNETVRRVTIGQPGRIYDSTVTVNNWKIGQVLYTGDKFVGRSAVIWLVVNVTVATDGTKRSPHWKAGGVNGDRSYAPMTDIVVPEPGFLLNQDIVFELDPADLAGFTLTVLDRPPIYAFDPQIDVPLGISAQQAAEAVAANRYARVKTVVTRPEVIT